MIKIKLDVTKLDKSAFFKAQKATYADLVLHENKNGEDQYGNAGFVTQDFGKDRRQAMKDSGERAPIIGNYKVMNFEKTKGQAYAAKVLSEPDADQSTHEDDIPF